MSASTARAAKAAPRRLRHWLLGEFEAPARAAANPVAAIPSEHQRSWWRVMCLTGLDYFSTLGYQPGIAALAAGLVSPIATLLLVALTVFGALPVYRRVARESHEGLGSIALLERVLPKWFGKIFVLVLLGFACTDFVITITLSAADASAHVLENPYVPDPLRDQQLLLTLILIALLGAVFLRGFTEAIGIAVPIVAVYLVLNAIVVITSLVHLAEHPQVVVDWRSALHNEHPNAGAIIAIAFVVFPKLALGLSGFETGVAVMPLIRGRRRDTAEHPVGRIIGTHRLLTTAALIMSTFLITSSIVTTLLIPQEAFRSGGPANGRALAFLAHQYLGSAFGTLYDLSTVLILWFAGASAMAGLLNLIPRYLPRYGMAPDWIQALRPLVLVFIASAFIITIVFDASVTAQGGAYATGVLVLITSASLAVTLSAWRRRRRRAFIGYGAIAAVFIYTTIANVIERPDGVKIGAVFIATILITSIASRIHRATELRTTGIEMDAVSHQMIKRAAANGAINIIANEPDSRDQEEYRDKAREQYETNHLPTDEAYLFLEVTITDPSDFSSPLRVFGEYRFGYEILRVEAASVANAIAAVALHIRDTSGRVPHIYFSWTEGNPVLYLLRYLFFGVGEIAPLTREVLRQAEPNQAHRPRVHVG